MDKVWEKLQAGSIQVLTWDDEAYPRRLKEIDQPPPVLYLRGNLLPEDEWAVAIVGTRRVTAYGRQVAEELASVLARNGVTVISGLARGVDSIAHQAALNAGGRTIAVMGTGVEQIYPPENRRLAEQMLQQGALVSDYPLGTPPDGINFPPRNRIISGLALAVVVVEAGLTSGALITASFAAEQGREVFAVPGNITAPQSQGTNRLILDGATPLLSPQQVLEALNLTMVTEHRAGAPGAAHRSNRKAAVPGAGQRTAARGRDPHAHRYAHRTGVSDTGIDGAERHGAAGGGNELHRRARAGGRLFCVIIRGGFLWKLIVSNVEPSGR